MKKVRIEALFSEEEEHLNSLIAFLKQNPTIEHVRKLIEWAGKDYNNAIIQLGNLVIDGVFDPKQIGAEEWNLGNSQDWSWLINVLTEANYCTEKMFEYCTRRVISRRGHH